MKYWNNAEIFWFSEVCPSDFIRNWFLKLAQSEHFRILFWPCSPNRPEPTFLVFIKLGVFINLHVSVWQRRSDAEVICIQELQNGNYCVFINIYTVSNLKPHKTSMWNGLRVDGEGGAHPPFTWSKFVSQYYDLLPCFETIIICFGICLYVLYLLNNLK